MTDVCDSLLQRSSTVSLLKAGSNLAMVSVIRLKREESEPQTVCFLHDLVFCVFGSHLLGLGSIETIQRVATLFFVKF